MRNYLANIFFATVTRITSTASFERHADITKHSCWDVRTFSVVKACCSITHRHVGRIPTSEICSFDIALPLFSVSDDNEFVAAVVFIHFWIWDWSRRPLAQWWKQWWKCYRSVLFMEQLLLHKNSKQINNKTRMVIVSLLSPIFLCLMPASEFLNSREVAHKRHIPLG